jgi:peroxiredoxin
MGDQAGPGDPNVAPSEKLVGQSAPAFTLENLEGQRISPLEDFKGNVIVLDFWASWCPPCREGLPHLDKLYQEKREQGVAVFAVNVRETDEQAKAFMSQQNLSVPVLLDTKGEVSGQYLVSGIPQTVVIGRDGKVSQVLVGFGAGSAEKLAEAVKAAQAN